MRSFRHLSDTVTPLPSFPPSSAHSNSSICVSVSKFNYLDSFRLLLYHGSSSSIFCGQFPHRLLCQGQTGISLYHFSTHWVLHCHRSHGIFIFLLPTTDHCHDESSPYLSHICVLPIWRHHLQSPDFIKHRMIQRVTNAYLPL